jgi:hypothetical protein
MANRPSFLVQNDAEPSPLLKIFEEKSQNSPFLNRSKVIKPEKRFPACPFWFLGNNSPLQSRVLTVP